MDELLIGPVFQQRVERLVRRLAESMGQAGAKDLPVRNTARPNRDGLATCQGMQRLIEMTQQYSPAAKVSSKRFAREIAAPPQKLLAAPNRLVKREIFEAMERIVMNEGAHGPVLGDHLAGETDNAAKLHATGVRVDGIHVPSYFVHAGDSMWTVR